MAKAHYLVIVRQQTLAAQDILTLVGRLQTLVEDERLALRLYALALGLDAAVIAPFV